MNMRLIDADALKADYGMAEDCKDCKTGYRSCEYDRIYSKMDFCGWLDDAPTVDAIEVVRCRDCKHHDGIRCFRWNSTIITGFDDFCSNGERKDGDGSD